LPLRCRRRSARNNAKAPGHMPRVFLVVTVRQTTWWHSLPEVDCSTR
jgi:hypothetical protein